MQNFEGAIQALITLSLGTTGLYFFVKSRGVFLRAPSLLLPRKKDKNRTKASGALSPFTALCVALGGTIGVGNTIGVASAITLGGAGAVFWMWVSATLGMTLKYAEVYLSCLHRPKDGSPGGAAVLLKKLNRPVLSVLFSLCTVLVSFGMGNLAQSGAAAESLEQACHIPRAVSGALIALTCLFIFCGGMRRLGAFSRLFVPVASVFFFFLCFITLWKNRIYIPGAFVSIFREAFSFQALGGGFFGSLFCRGLSAGFARGIFSNEAGLGSAPLVHSAAESEPDEQALWGVREVFLDTHLVCTLSALCILSSPIYRAGEFDAAGLCTAVFEAALGKTGGVLFSLSLFLFAVASVLAWGYYGSRGVCFLSPRKGYTIGYYILFFAASFCGALFDLSGTLLFSDLANAAMALPNLYALWRFRHQTQFPVTKKSQCLHFVHKSFFSYGKINRDEGE